MIAKIKIDGNEIKIRQATRLGYITLPLAGGLADLSFPSSKLRRGRVQFNGQIAPTMTCCMTGLTVFEPIVKEKKMAELLNKIADEVFEKLRHTFRIRKLSCAECMTLMGMTREDVDKMKAMGVSNSQIYKIAGNGLVTNCVQYQMEHLYKCLVDNTYETTDERMVREGYGVE